MTNKRVWEGYNVSNKEEEANTTVEETTDNMDVNSDNEAETVTEAEVREDEEFEGINEEDIKSDEAQCCKELEEENKRLKEENKKLNDD